MRLWIKINIVTVIVASIAVFNISLAGNISYTDDVKKAIEQAALKSRADYPIINDTEDYCPSTYTNQTDDWITNVTFNTIDNTTGQDGPHSYGDYTDLVTNITPGATYTLTVSFFSEGLWTEHARAWFDWNADEVFAAAESYYLGSGVDATLSIEVTVPEDAFVGQSRFRVIEQYSTDPGANGACDGQGNHSSVYGETEDYSFYTGAVLDYDVAPTVFVSPTGVGQVGMPFNPVVTYSNLGGETATFGVEFTIELDGSEIFSETGSISNLGAGEAFDYEFAEYVPEIPGNYDLIATCSLINDEDPDNDTLTTDFFIFPAFLPPSNLIATGNQDGVIPLRWYEPSTEQCSLLVYDDGIIGNTFYYYSPENLIANAFMAIAPVRICTVYVHVLTEGDPYWPWPDGNHDPVEIRVWDGTGSPEHEIGYQMATASPGEDIVIAFDPPLVCNTNRFWVSFNNVNDTAPCDGLALDRTTNFSQYKWVRENGIWQNIELYEGDAMIRAKIFSAERNLSLTGNNPVMDFPIIADTRELTGYSLYRDAAPGVPIDEQHRIVEGITELAYDDWNVTNGTTYYYVVTAVYDDDGDIVESIPSNEVSARPAEGGMLDVYPQEIYAEIYWNETVHNDLTLYNYGDLDVTFSIDPSQFPSVFVSPENPYRDGTISAKFFSISEDHDKSTAAPDENSFPPIVTDHGGPDEFGYVWLDSDDVNGPNFSWIDPSGHYQLTMEDDDNQGPFALQFDFPFYGQIFSSFRICSNGWISFTNSSTAYSNTALPGASVENIIAPFWEDLNPEDGGSIYWNTNYERAVISWVDVPAYDWGYGVGPFTFQVIIDYNGRILFQYLDMNEPLDHATIGIQDASTTIGLQVAFDQYYAYNQLATEIKPGWLSVDPIEGIIPADSQITVDVIMDAWHWSVGTYEGLLTINSSDINDELPDIEVPVYMDVMADINEAVELPHAFSLSQNYPNPFNATTSIGFALTEKVKVDLSVYNMLGQKAATLVSAQLAAGYHTVNWDASDFSSGVYFYKITAGDKTEIREMTLLK